MREGLVIAVSQDALHRFSKRPVTSVVLVEGLGVEGDAHAGATVQHRYLKRRAKALPNLRQVHLIASELFDELKNRGFVVAPGALGENITTRGIDLLNLPLGTTLRLGERAAVRLTGLRVPCALIDKFKNGLKRQLIQPPGSPSRFRAGVMSVVAVSGAVRVGDTVRVELPPPPWISLPPLP